MQASWNGGAVAPWRVSGPGSPSPLVFPAGGCERWCPGPGQHSGGGPRERSGPRLPSQVLALSLPASAHRCGSVWLSWDFPSWETEVRAQAGVLLP